LPHNDKNAALRHTGRYDILQMVKTQGTWRVAANAAAARSGLDAYASQHELMVFSRTIRLLENWTKGGKGRLQCRRLQSAGMHG